MRIYARIDNAMVVEIFQTSSNISQLFHPSLVWVDITDVTPQPGEGWSAIQSGETWTFTAPNIVAVTLTDAQTAACNALTANLENFVRYLPSGMPRYSTLFNFSALMGVVQAGSLGTSMARLSTWYAAIQTAYVTQQSAIMVCTTVEEISEIDVSVAWFEARYGVEGTVSPDPNITLLQLGG